MTWQEMRKALVAAAVGFVIAAASVIGEDLAERRTWPGVPDWLAAAGAGLLGAVAAGRAVFKTSNAGPPPGGVP